MLMVDGRRRAVHHQGFGFLSFSLEGTLYTVIVLRTVTLVLGCD
jgi:hypothetical protein